jgi:hypothetical protein
MTIVLQHQFWDLAVGEEEFDVGLAFNGIPERLHIPLKAVKAFFDPSVQFGLQFTVEADGRAVMAGETEPKEAAKPQLEPKEAAQPQPPAERKLKPRNKKDEAAADPAGDANKTAAKPATDQAPSSGEVVRLDRFRKK